MMEKALAPESTTTRSAQSLIPHRRSRHNSSSKVSAMRACLFHAFSLKPFDNALDRLKTFARHHEDGINCRDDHQVRRANDCREYTFGMYKTIPTVNHNTTAQRGVAILVAWQ